MSRSHALAEDSLIGLPTHADDPITLRAADGIAAWQTLEGDDLLQVFVGSSERCCEGKVPIAGRYGREGDALTFTPAFPLVAGQAYTARIQAAGPEPDQVTFAIPFTTPAVDAVVTDVFPSGDVLPENLLRFYVHFSVPMAPHAAFDHIQLLDASGSADQAAFMRFKQELWNEDRTRLTVLFDPGRIKREVATNVELGPAIEAGKPYRIAIAGGWPSADGRSTLADFSKSFTASSALRERPDVQRWQVTSPCRDSRDALELVLDRPFDRHRLEGALRVVTGDGHNVAGTVQIGTDERVWRFTPDQAWTGHEVRVVVDSRLEDVAGNNFRDLLDQPLTEERRDEPTTELSVPLRNCGEQR